MGLEAEVISYGKQWIDDDDIAAVTEVLKSDFLTQGPRIDQLEKALAEYTGARYAVVVANGTAALHLAVQALNITKGKQGITSPITFAASANCLLYNGLKPGFADIEENTYCIDPVEIEKQITDETAVLIPVHFAGQPADMEHIRNIARKHGLFIIEDASHAIGSRFKNGKMVGSCCYSDMAIFSFHPVKTIATGEGGAVTTNDKDIYEKLLLLRNHGITKDPGKFKVRDSKFPTGPWYYEMQELGFNYRLTDIHAAIGLSQLKKIDRFIRRRREIVAAYNHAFKDIPWLTLPYERDGVQSAFHLYVIKIDFKRIKKTRTQVMQELREQGIGTQVHYIPVHLQPYYREQYGTREGDYPKAEGYYEHCLSIPLYPAMSDEDVHRVIAAVIKSEVNAGFPR